VEQGAIAPGESVVLATFRDATGEALGQVVTEGLRADLAQATIIRPVGRAEERKVRSPAELASGEPLYADAAREVAMQAGVRLVLDGEVARDGGGFLITATMMVAETGRHLASFRSSADEPDELILSIGHLALGIREKSGEPRRTRRQGEILKTVTTGSLETLRRYAEAERALDQGDGAGAMDLLQRVVAMDSSFVLAWQDLGPLYEEIADTANAIQAYRRVVDRWNEADARARLEALVSPGG